MAEWFVVNIADAPAMRHERSGLSVRFESPDDPFPDFAINVRLLEPGHPVGMYHAESVQEDFLVLSGECLAIVEGEEQRLKAWDFLHCPAGTNHIIVGAGEGPCAVLMVGARTPGRTIHYPVNEVAARYGASVAADTSDPGEAYADWPWQRTPARMPWPPG